MKRCSKLKNNQEITKHEVKYFPLKISTYLTAHPFVNNSIVQLSLIDSSINSRIRQELYQQYKNVAEESQLKMMSIYMECAEKEMQQSQEQFDLQMKQLWEREKTFSSEEKLTPLMYNLINERLANITARIEYLYHYKVQLHETKSTTH